MQNTEVEVNKPEINAPKKKKRASSLDRIKARSGWFFIAPFVIGFIVIYLPIVFESIHFSFTEVKVLTGGGFNAEWVGFKNYQEALFDNPNFVMTLTLGIRQLIFDIPAIVIFALFMAILLNQKMTGRAVFRAIFFIPVILATGIIDRIDQGNEMLSYLSDTSRSIATGTSDNAATTDTSVTSIVSVFDFEWLFMSMKGVSIDLVIYIVNAVNNIYNIINRSGVQMLIFLGGLQSISPTIYESAFMEGASAWETFWKITFPMISPMIFVNAIYTVIDSFTAKSNTVMRLIEFTYDEPGGQVLSSAMAWMYFIIVILMIAVVGLIVSSFVFYQRREN
ncbi:MAG: sugar ABC transporter permease [Oscillospiraceae bacterium]|nr:sugar ABC transporter permease [Oscillospiraceae bacterium]